jgi:hypothetical protein
MITRRMTTTMLFQPIGHFLNVCGSSHIAISQIDCRITGVDSRSLSLAGTATCSLMFEARFLLNVRNDASNHDSPVEL